MRIGFWVTMQKIFNTTYNLRLQFLTPPWLLVVRCKGKVHLSEEHGKGTVLSTVSLYSLPSSEIYTACGFIWKI